MEVGEQSLHHRKAVTRLNYQIHWTCERLQHTAMGLSSSLQSPNAGGSNSNHAPHTVVHRLNNSRRHLDPLAVQFQLTEVFRLDRPECSKPHMQGDPRQLNPLSP